MFVSVIIAAAGSSTRMGGGISKQLLTLSGKPVLEHSLIAFSNSEKVKEIIISAKEDEIEVIKEISSSYPKVKAVVKGGSIRQESVSYAIEKISDKSEIIAIHDAARPLIATYDIDKIIDLAYSVGAVCPVSKATDTVKISTDGTISNTIDRNTVFLASTPQAFKTEIYKKAVASIKENDVFTDDASIVENIGKKVHIYIMENQNTKITTKNDFMNMNYHASRVGHGYDVHRLVEGRKLILGGVEIEHSVGLLGHSDADVLLHAIMDALLGAAGLGDIGRHFPDTDASYKDISSLKLLEKVSKIIKENGYIVENVDATVVAQKPKLSPYIPQMIKNIADVLGIEESQINVKATTEEHLGFTGEMLGISAHAVAILKK
jgi:2-C-methyl-D-erythritol 2,4-cyclodiphosphate synthase/2-C-methyl-D-erythritol 4-phosphate cytidylyltransferase